MALTEVVDSSCHYAMSRASSTRRSACLSYDRFDFFVFKVQKITDPVVRVFVQTEIKFYLSLDEDARQRLRKQQQLENSGEKPPTSDN